MTHNLPTPDPTLPTPVWISRYINEMTRLLPEDKYVWVNEFANVHYERHIKSFLNPEVAAERDARSIRVYSDLQIRRIIGTMGRAPYQPPTGLEMIDNGYVHHIKFNRERLKGEFASAESAEIEFRVKTAAVAMADKALADVVKASESDVVRPDEGDMS